MLHFDNSTIHLRRPITVASVATALGVKPFEILAELIPMQVFVAPHQGIDDDTVFRLGERIGVDFRIDEDGGTSPIPDRPVDPVSPAPLIDLEALPQTLSPNDWKSARFEGANLPRSLSRSPLEGVRHSVDLHVRGILCPAEAWNGFVDHVTEETFAACMAELTPDLEAYVHHHILAIYPKLYQEAEPTPHAIKHRQALKWLADYYAR